MPPIHVYHETIEGKCYECCVEKRKRKSWLKNADDGWTKFVPSSFAKLVYVYIFLVDVYLPFLPSKASNRFFQKYCFS